MLRAGTIESSAHASDAYAARGRYVTTTNAFRDKLPAVPAVTFTAERDRAFDVNAPTGACPCDIADQLHSPVPATTPLLLARYLRIRRGETLPLAMRATGAIFYVVRGAGETRQRDDCLQWSEGDIFLIPGGDASHRAAEDAVLWAVSNEPEVAFHRLEPPPSGGVSITHFPAARIRDYLAEVCATPAPKDATGRAIIFTTPEFERMASLTPSMTLALNTMDPGKTQMPHRHSSAAVTLAIQGEGCHSTVDGTRMDWQPFATMITPATAAHSHHNEGDRLATFLIVQDGGVFYQCRAIGFSYA